MTAADNLALLFPGMLLWPGTHMSVFCPRLSAEEHTKFLSVLGIAIDYTEKRLTIVADFELMGGVVGGGHCCLQNFQGRFSICFIAFDNLGKIMGHGYLCTR